MTGHNALGNDLPRGAEIPLWPHGAPGSEGMTAPELVEPPTPERDYLKVSRIHNPSLTVFLAPPEVATGAAMVIAPGGGHMWLSWDMEGTYVAGYLNSIGVSAFVLKYRLAREQDSPYQVEVHALQDAQRGIRLVRARADAWRIDPSRVAMMGFSAGAQLTYLAATRCDPGQPDAADPLERISARPDYQVLIYGGPFGEAPAITADAPPAFILGAHDDPLMGDLLPQLYLAFKHAGVPAELHIYVDGGHGFGLRRPPRSLPSTSTWHLRLRDWLEDRGMLRRAALST